MKLITFSPTGTTSRVVEQVARGLDHDCLERIDLTTPAAATADRQVLRGGTAVIGVPVHYGRVPRVAVERLSRLRAENTRAVLVVVYGNRDFDDALLELHGLAAAAGFKPVAAGAFIGEHSFSTAARPIAAGRPDVADCASAEEFGRRVALKLAGLEDPSCCPPLDLPGDFPHREIPPRPDAVPFSREGECGLCGSCAEVCPTAAIKIGEKVETDRDSCILCCACVKSCPRGGRVVSGEWAAAVGEWLAENCAGRRDPAVFI